MLSPECVFLVLSILLIKVSTCLGCFARIIGMLSLRTRSDIYGQCASAIREGKDINSVYILGAVGAVGDEDCFRASPPMRMDGRYCREAEHE